MPLARRSPAVLALLLTACGGDSPADSSTATTAASPSTTAIATTAADPTTDTATSTGDPTPTTSTTATSEPTSTTEPATVTDTTTTPITTDTTTTITTDTPGTTTDTPDTPTELRVLHFNLCHSGIAGCFKGDAPITKAVDVITAVAPAVVTLNEVCKADLPLLAEQTGAVDHHFTPALKADDTPVKCKNGDAYGIGLLSWSPPTWDAPVHGVYADQSSTTERRVWLCMGYTGFTACTTHLSTKGATALAQCKDLVGGALATAAAMGPALMAGDWNLKYKGDPNAQACVPDGFYRKGDGALQHVIASDDLGFLETIVIDMQGTTDHPALEVRLTLP